MAQAAQILSYLSRLAPTPGRRDEARHWTVVAQTQDLVWLEGEVGVAVGDGDEAAAVATSDPLARLAATDALQPERLLRAGWLWLAGTVALVEDGAPSSRRTKVCLPVFERTVTLDEARASIRPNWHSDLELHPYLAEVLDDVESLERLPDEFVANGGSLDEGQRARLRDALEPTGLAGFELAAPSTHPYVVRGRQSLSLVPGAGIYLGRGVKPSMAARHLQRWAATDVSDTALARLYGVTTDTADVDTADRPSTATSPLPLNARQRQAMRRIETEPVVTIAGPPGTGKSHVAVAAACEAVHRGETVLMATKSDHAAQSICEILERHATPAYVRFGSSRHRRQAVERLTARAPTLDRAARAEIEQRARAAADDLANSMRRIHSALGHERSFRAALVFRRDHAGAAAAAPGALEESLDLHHAEHLLAQVQSTSWWDRLLRDRRERRLRAMVRARRDASIADIADAIAVGRADYDTRHAIDHEDVNLGADWSGLERAEAVARAATAELLLAERTAALNRRERRSSGAAAAALGSVLRAGKQRRARLLEGDVGDDFLLLAPLWVGTLDEIESTLPAMAALFDVVIFDEASQIDQLAAATALCRAERAVVVGDPQQLRHVSFVSDAESDRARRAVGLDPAAGDSSLSLLLDVRRNSLFDVAAAAAPVTRLDEHFRSIPHLIEFSDERFYDGSLRLMTQHPAVEGLDAIGHTAVAGTRNADGVVEAEVAVVAEALDEMLRRRDGRSVGVITPFRAQADALQDALVRRFSLEQIRSLDLRVGTVHGMQGTERDVVLASLGLGEADLGQSLRFVQDPNLFNVMITRARRHCQVFHAFDPEALPPGLLRDWFAAADRPPELQVQARPRDEWTAQIARELARTGLRVVADYPVAGWTVDLAVGEGPWAFGVETGVHPDGVDTHIERHLTLRRAGWHLTEAFESRWLLRAEHAVAQLGALAASRRAGVTSAT